MTDGKNGEVQQDQPQVDTVMISAALWNEVVAALRMSTMVLRTVDAGMRQAQIVQAQQQEPAPEVEKKEAGAE